MDIPRDEHPPALPGNPFQICRRCEQRKDLGHLDPDNLKWYCEDCWLEFCGKKRLCFKCREWHDRGSVDLRDIRWYCNDCWDSYESSAPKARPSTDRSRSRSPARHRPPQDFRGGPPPLGPEPDGYRGHPPPGYDPYRRHPPDGYPGGPPPPGYYPPPNDGRGYPPPPGWARPPDGGSSPAGWGPPPAGYFHGGSPPGAPPGWGPPPGVPPVGWGSPPADGWGSPAGYHSKDGGKDGKGGKNGKDGKDGKGKGGGKQNTKSGKGGGKQAGQSPRVVPPPGKGTPSQDQEGKNAGRPLIALRDLAAVPTAVDNFVETAMKAADETTLFVRFKKTSPRGFEEDAEKTSCFVVKNFVGCVVREPDPLRSFANWCVARLWVEIDSGDRSAGAKLQLLGGPTAASEIMGVEVAEGMAEKAHELNKTGTRTI